MFECFNGLLLGEEFHGLRDDGGQEYGRCSGGLYGVGYVLCALCSEFCSLECFVACLVHSCINQTFPGRIHYTVQFHIRNNIRHFHSKFMKYTICE